QLTSVGEQMLRYPLPARLSRILVAAQNCPQKDKKELVDYLAHWIEPDNPDRLRRNLASFLTASPITKSPQSQDLEKIILTGFPDHVALYRGPKYHDFIHAQGDTLKGAPAIIDQVSAFPAQSLFIILEVGTKGQIFRLVPIEKDWLYDLEPLPLVEKMEVEFHSSRKKIYHRTSLPGLS
ncbi:MAG: hypothetical protein WCG27_08285, partial [Pseudomonadota bacterium]